MKRSCAVSLVLAAALLVIGSAYAQQPPDVVQSDAEANTAMGSAALGANQPGNGAIANTAAGYEALQVNTTGSRNAAFGESTLFSNTTGINNTGCGAESLARNNTGAYNSASGAQALFLNTTGNYNTATGAMALYFNTTGTQNTAVGEEALFSNKAGGNNIALGAYAGWNINGGYRNIDIGSVGAGSDVGTIRIGSSGAQTATFVAGINGAHVTGSAVYISSTGQLGVLASSERYKTEIAPMGERTGKLQQLRPVTFQLKTDPKATVQYGLIAEEVANVYPELVVRDDAGKIQGVRYEELAPMLLNEMQKQAAEIRDLKQQQKQAVTQAVELRDVQQQLAELHAALVKLQSKDELVAQR